MDRGREGVREWVWRGEGAAHFLPRAREGAAGHFGGERIEAIFRQRVSPFSVRYFS